MGVFTAKKSFVIITNWLKECFWRLILNGNTISSVEPELSGSIPQSMVSQMGRSASISNFSERDVLCLLNKLQVV